MGSNTTARPAWISAAALVNIRVKSAAKVI